MKAAGFVVLLFAFSPLVHAESRGVASLEWLADSSPSIGVYIVDSVVDQTDSKCTLSLRLLKTLKQNSAKVIRVEYPLQEYPLSPENIYPISHPTTVAVGDRFLIFDGAEHGPINLTTAQPYDAWVAAVTAGGRALTDAGAILHTVKKRLRTHPTPERVQKGSDNFYHDLAGRITQPETFFNSFDSYSIIVPADLRPMQPSFEPEGLITNTEVKRKGSVPTFYTISVLSLP